MSACARGGEPRQALRLLEELKREGGGVRPNTVIYNTLLGMCKGNPVRGGGAGGGHHQGNEASAATTTVPQQHFHQNGFGGAAGGAVAVPGGASTVRVSFPNAVVGGREPAVTPPRSGEVEGSSGSRSGNANAKVRPGAAAAWGQDPEELMRTALALLDEMMMEAGGRGGRERWDSRDGCAPDKLSFELAMQACVNAGRPEEAIRVFRELRRWSRGGSAAAAAGIRLGLATYRLGLTAASAAGDGSAAAVLLEDMEDAGIVVDEVSGAVCSRGVRVWVLVITYVVLRDR